MQLATVHPNTTETKHRITVLLFKQVDGVVLFVLLHVPPEGILLLAQNRDHLVVHVGEKQFGVGL